MRLHTMAQWKAANGPSSVYPALSQEADYVAAGFIPEIWSGKLIEKFYAATVLAAISNTDYEGEIKSYGDRVKIRTKPTLAINNYLINGDLTLQRPVGASVELTIDQGKYFAAILDDVIEKQSDVNNLSIWADDASEQMKIVGPGNVLLFLLGPSSDWQCWSDGWSDLRQHQSWCHRHACPVRSDVIPPRVRVEIIDIVLRIGRYLDEQNIPETGRWIVMPTWATFQLKRSELREVFVSGDQVSILRNGKFGRVDRFTI